MAGTITRPPPTPRSPLSSPAPRPMAIVGSPARLGDREDVTGDQSWDRNRWMSMPPGIGG
jgi:hypothetical protein